MRGDTYDIQLLDIEKENAQRASRQSKRKKNLFINDTLSEIDLNYLERIALDSSIKWNHLMPCGVAEVFCMAPLSILDQIWNKLDRGKPVFQVHYNLNCTLTEWKPSQFENEQNRLYESFCPIIMCMNTQPDDYGSLRMSAYKSAKYSNNHNEKRKWYAFPSLNYLPKHVTKVLAGDGGLLVCCGGVQPCHSKPTLDERLLPLTHDEEDDYDRQKYPLGQDIILITNPLTQEYYFLSPIPYYILQEKNACLIMTPCEPHPLNKKQKRVVFCRTNTTNDSSESSEEIESDLYNKKLEEFCHDYVVVVVGHHHQSKFEDELNKEKLVVCIYESIKKEKGWWLRPLPFISRWMPSKHGRSGIGFWKKDSWIVVFFGGILVEEHFEEFQLEDFGLNGNENPTTLNNQDYNIDHSKIKKSNNDCDEKLLNSHPLIPNTIKPIIGDSILPKNLKIIPTKDECDNLRKKLWCEESSSESTITSILDSCHSTRPPMLQQVLVETCNPVIYYVSIVEDDDFALALPFNPFGTKENHLQCPIVIQPFRWQSTMPILYAVTRSIILADTILIFGIEFKVGYKGNPIPSGNYHLLTKMPQSIFNDVFQTIDYSSKQFECSGGNGLICIRVIDINIIAIYDIIKDSWYLEDYTKYFPTKANGNSFQMFENCVYEPSFWQKADITNQDNNIDELLHHCTPEKYFGCYIPK